ncbi:hypothetical protein GF420_11525 [candidate division GN15 bacterium]|nr:hypothetical protein [candidate division GN15 bacterium]
MKVKGTELAKSYAVFRLCDRYGIALGQARRLKYGDDADVAADRARVLIEAGLAEAVEEEEVTDVTGGG